VKRRPLDPRILLAPADAEELIARLAADDEFRARLALAPAAVLAAYGVEFSPETLPRNVTLPSKDDVRAAARAMRPREFSGNWAGAAARAKFSPMPSRALAA
jgi:putative modified peptide